jgi:two-component sensor histidine kinase
VEAFQEAFLGRLHALANAHAMLVDGRWRGADLKDLVEQAVAAYRLEHPELVEIAGESVAITPQQSLALGLVLHELGTNAAKYGALSDQDGQVRISWRKEKVDGSARLRFSSQERSSQPLPPFE